LWETYRSTISSIDYIQQSTAKGIGAQKVEDINVIAAQKA